MIPGFPSSSEWARTPIPIDEAEIAAIQSAVKSGLPSQPWPFVQIGQRVRIEHGPLLWAEGVLLDFRGHPSPCVICHTSPTFHCCPSRRCLGNTNSPTPPGLHWSGKAPLRSSIDPTFYMPIFQLVQSSWGFRKPPWWRLPLWLPRLRVGSERRYP